MPLGLVYVNVAQLPGITRHRTAEGFEYRLPDGRVIDDDAELSRIRRLAIPPAYTDVWICPSANGHLQATGRDARGRKQYRYHADWNTQRGAEKFTRLEAFGRALPRIRRRVARDLAADDGRTLSYRVVVATLVRLLDTTVLRVGNGDYARHNRSYGLTTLRDRHVDVKATRAHLSFRGKHGVRQQVTLDDPRLVRIVRRCKQLPGQELFQYEADGAVRSVGSGDVNDYLCEACGERFTAKDFRTWHGSVLALELIRLACTANGAREDAPVEVFSAQRMLQAVAERLGNTVAVCRKSYIHPAILTLGQQLANRTPVLAAEQWYAAKTRPESAGLQATERRLLAFLADDRRREQPAAVRRRPPRHTGRKAVNCRTEP